MVPERRDGHVAEGLRIAVPAPDDPRPVSGRRVVRAPQLGPGRRVLGTTYRRSLKTAIWELGPIKLYIAGHTDTVGAAAYNLNLSRRRAQSIAGWFRKNGLRIPIAYEGYGGIRAAGGHADNTDEPRNRRVDYILSVEDPILKATEFQAVWKLVN